MKKLISILLTMALILSMSVTVFADEVNQDSDTQNGTTTITYSVEPTYTVTIPASVSLGETATISVENVVVAKGQQVEVAVSDDTVFTVATDEGAELAYTVKNGETEVAAGDIVLKVDPDTADNGSTTLTFIKPENVQYAGTYKGTVTFTVAVTTVEPESPEPPVEDDTIQ